MSSSDQRTTIVAMMWFAVALIGIVWGYFYIPETKGVTLEKIEEHWRKGTKPKDIHK